MRRTRARSCLEDEPCWRVLGAAYKLVKGRDGVAVGVSQLARTARVRNAEARRLASYLAGKNLVTFTRGRVALTSTGLANVVWSLRPPAG